MSDEQIREHVCVDAEGNEWIPSVLAASLIPSARPGKRTHLSTLHRLRQQGRLDAARRREFGAGWWFRLDQIRALRVVQAVPRQDGKPIEGVAVLPQRRATEAAMADLAAHAGAGRKGA